MNISIYIDSHVMDRAVISMLMLNLSVPVYIKLSHLPPSLARGRPVCPGGFEVRLR